MTEPVPYIVHESVVSKMERTVKRLWILCIIMFVSVILTNAIWICYECTYERSTTTTITRDIDTGSGDASVSGIGNVYGENQADGHSH